MTSSKITKPAFLHHFQKIWSILGTAPLWAKLVGLLVWPVITIAFVILWPFPDFSDAASTLAERAPIPLVGTLGIAYFVGAILSTLLSLALVRPLKNLLAGIKKIESGDLSARVNIWAKDEIGQVQEAFNTMAANLERSHNAIHRQNMELTLLNTLSSALVDGQEEDAFLEFALSNVVALMPAESGAIYLLTDGGEYLNLHAIYGEVSSALRNAVTHIPLIETPILQVVQSGRATILDDLRDAHQLSEEVRTAVAEEHYVSWICAPLKEDKQVIGTISLGRQELQPFSNEDVILLEAVGNVIGLALANTQLLESLRSKEGELKSILRRTIRSQENERKRISRELHDETGQALTSILLRLKALQDESDIDTIHDRINGLRYLTNRTLEEVRRLSLDLRPTALDDLGLIPAIRAFVQQCIDRSGLDIHFSTNDNEGKFSQEVEIVLYRAIQEGLTNTIRHAEASNANVILEHNAQAVWLTISDNGKGMSKTGPHNGLGLLGMQERVNLLGGQINFCETAEGGTCIQMNLPLELSN